MLFEDEEFKTLYRRAKDFRDIDRYADAATLYERALRTTGGTEEERLWAKHGLGDCFYTLGQYTEALAHYGEVYVTAKEQAEFHELAYHSFYSQIEILRKLQEAERTETNANLNKRLELVEEGLRWLRDIGRETWRHALLLHRADALWALGEREQALDAVEEAYRLVKEFGKSPGYTLAAYAKELTNYARQLGRYERCLQILDETEESDMDPLDRVLILVARAQVLREMEPPRLAEAIDAARRAVRLVDEIQVPRERLHAYADLVDCTIAVNSFAEVKDALRVVREVALENETLDRPYFLRYARDSFQRNRNALAGEEDKAARELCQLLSEWLEEVKQALEE